MASIFVRDVRWRLASRAYVSSCALNFSMIAFGSDTPMTSAMASKSDCTRGVVVAVVREVVGISRGGQRPRKGS